MTAHDLANGTSWAVIDRPYNSDASRLFFSMWAHFKFLEIRRSDVPVSGLRFFGRLFAYLCNQRGREIAGLQSRAPDTFRNFDPKSRSGGRPFAGLEVFLGSPFQAVFLFRAINAAFLEDFVLCGHDCL